MTDTATLIDRLRERSEGMRKDTLDAALMREAAAALATLEAERDEARADHGRALRFTLDAQAALASVANERDALSRQMRLVARMAQHGVAADTTPEQCLATIAHFAEAALVAVEPPPLVLCPCGHMPDAGCQDDCHGRNITFKHAAVEGGDA